MGSLAEYKRAVNEGVKYQCGKCNHQATTKGNLAGHKRAVHEGVKYPCMNCNQQFTSKQISQGIKEIYIKVIQDLSR